MGWPDLFGAWFTGRHTRDASGYVARHIAGERLRNEVQRLTGSPSALEWRTHVDGRVELTQVACQQRSPNRGLVPAQTTVRVLGELARSGPTRGELRSAFGSTRALLSDPRRLSDIASAAALDQLMGLGPAEPSEVLARIKNVSVAEVQSAWSSAMTTGVWLFRDGDDVPDEAGNPLASCGEPPTTGRSYEVTPDSSSECRLVVGESAVTEQHSPTDWVTIPFDRCAAMVTWTNGATSIYGVDGDLIHFDAETCPSAETINEQLSAVIHEDLRISASIPHLTSNLNTHSVGELE